MTFGEAIDLALASKLAFFQCDDGSMDVCGCRTKDEERRRLAKLKEKALSDAAARTREEEKAAETGETEVAEEPPKSRRRVVHVEMPRKPKNHLEKWRAEARRSRS